MMDRAISLELLSLELLEETSDSPGDAACTL